MPLILNITLTSKDSPTVNLTVSDEAQAIILGSTSNAPLITSVVTGSPGERGLSGTASIDDGSITTAKLQNSSVTNSKIADNAVFGAKIVNSSIISSKIANNAIISSKIADNAITAAKIAPGAITLELIDIFADGAIKPDKLKPGSLVEANFANSSVTTSKIANAAITAVKLADRTLTGSKIQQNVVLDGAKINGAFQLLGSSPAYLLGPTEDDLHIQSEAGLVFRIDSDNDSVNNFLFKNGAGATIFTLDEAGNATFTGNIITTGNSTVDGVDVSTLPTSDTNTQLPLLDEDNMASNSSSSVPSQQSVKAYVDGKTYISTSQASAITANTSKATNVTTNLGITTSTTTVIVTSSDGNNATVPVATTSIGGVMSKAIFDQHTANVAKNTNVVTNLAITGSAAARTITSSDGTDAVIPLGTTSVSGLLSPSLFDEIDANTAKVTNVVTNLSVANSTGARVIASSDGTNATIPIATTSVSGVMSKAIFDEHTANVSKNTNVSTNLGITGDTGARVITSSDGNNATIPVATTSVSGLLTPSLFDEIDANTAKNTNATHSGDVTGSGALTIAADAVTYAKMQNVSATNVVLGRDSTGAGIVEEISAANLRTIINVEDGATADQTQADIHGLAITTVGTLDTGNATAIVTDASTSAKGKASFSSDNFAVSSGAVTIKDGGVDLTAEVTGVLPNANLDADTMHLNVAQTVTSLKTYTANMRIGGDTSTSNNWISIDCRNGSDTTGGGISFFETGSYDVDTPQYGAKIVYNEDDDTFSLGTIQNNSYLKQLYIKRNLDYIYLADACFIEGTTPGLILKDSSTTVADGDNIGVISWSNNDDTGTTLQMRGVATENHADDANGGSKIEFYVTPNTTSAVALALTVGQDKSLTVEGAIELGHATDTTIARTAAGKVTIEGVRIKTQELYVKILPSNFIADDGGRPLAIDDASSNRFIESHGSNPMFASVEIPLGFKATHVHIYGDGTSAMTVFEADVNTRAVTSKGTGNIGTNLAITNVTADATNYILIQLVQTSGEQVNGGIMTIAAV